MFRLIDTQKKLRDDPVLSEKKSTFICKVCGSLISGAENLIIIGGSTPYHTCTNPENQTFHLMTLSFCMSVFEASLPIMEATWFPGYTWTILCCVRCYTHLGWQYDGPGQTPARFYGMIRDRLVLEDI